MEILLITVFTIFAFFGLLHMANGLLFKVNNRQITEAKSVCIVITIKDEEESVEGMLRAAAWRHSEFYTSKVPYIFVIDAGSTDNTFDIAKKLELEYEFLRVFDKVEYINYLEDVLDDWKS